MADGRTRHVLGLSGGKDSSALAVYMRDKIPDMEYYFCDTGKELAETYEYLDRLEAYLGRPIVRLNEDRGFDHWLSIYGNYLPAPNMRWCTKILKLRPFEQFVGDDDVVSYVAIRADENREGYISTRPNISARFPFKEDGLCKADVLRILEKAGLGLPTYYEWRSRSGCFFCFFQRKIEWIGLLERHPDLYHQAMEYEKLDQITGQRYTWCQGESLEELAMPERVAEIKAQAARDAKRKRSGTLVDLFGDDDPAACLICSL